MIWFSAAIPVLIQWYNRVEEAGDLYQIPKRTASEGKKKKKTIFIFTLSIKW